MQEQPFLGVTFREAVLSSLLAHAAIVILILLFPGAFATSPEDRRIASLDPNAPIPMRFVTEPEPESIAFGDAGPRVSSDPRPPDAPPPRNENPYARGNTPNRFVAPPVPAPPAPTPGTDEADRETPGEQEPSASEERTQQERTGEERETDTVADGSRFAVPGGSTAGDGDSRNPRRSLRDALDNLSGSGGLAAGGAPLRFDNPVGGLSGPSGGLSFDTKGFDWGPYARKIYWIIWANWTRGWPPAARAGLTGVSTVRFRIHRDGTISAITILDSSGTEAFDTCATLALEASSPLPPLPADFTKESEGITARFLYNLSEP